MEKQAQLPLKRISLFSSGVGFFEYSGVLAGPAEITLPFTAMSVNDALKSLTINDPVSDFPAVRYSSAAALLQSLTSLKIDLSANTGPAQILNSQKGAEIEVLTPAPVTGKIVCVEERAARRILDSDSGRENTQSEFFLVLWTGEGVKAIRLPDISSFAFKDAAINADFGRALDILSRAGNSEKRELTVSLAGAARRNVRFSYVIPMPVWKVSYRLELSREEPLIQGWAIVDNGSDMDWEDVSLSLVTGRPVSFIQNLYAPYHTQRPELPLAIAGFAEASTYESGSGGEASDYASRKYARRPSTVREDINQSFADMSADDSESCYAEEESFDPPPAMPEIFGGVVETAAAAAEGAQFEFTLRRPVSLGRRQSAMFPLVEAKIKAEKLLVFSGAKMSSARQTNPAAAVELVNTSGMKLPAGPITVYDGTYAGDALVEFLPLGEKRLIAYGEDLSVTGSAVKYAVKVVSSAAAAGGNMFFTNRHIHETEYSVRNALPETKTLIIEHAFRHGARLVEPAAYHEKTPALYRFRLELPADADIKFAVKEEEILYHTYALTSLKIENLLAYSTSGDIPAKFQAALKKAVQLKQRIQDAVNEKDNLREYKQSVVDDQDRIRKNLEAAGSTSAHGLEYGKRMAAMDAEIDALNARIAEREKGIEAAEKKFRAYAASMKFGDVPAGFIAKKA